MISRATVSNVPAYPKKLPTVLIAAFATLMLSSGFVIDARRSWRRPRDLRRSADAGRRAADGLGAAGGDIVNDRAAASKLQPSVSSDSSIANVAYNLRRADIAAASIAVFGAVQGINTSQTAIKACARAG